MREEKKEKKGKVERPDEMTSKKTFAAYLPCENREQTWQLRPQQQSLSLGMCALRFKEERERKTLTRKGQRCIVVTKEQNGERHHVRLSTS